MTRCLQQHLDVTGEDDSGFARLAMECPYKEYAGWDTEDLIIPVPDSVVATSRPRFDNVFLPPEEQLKLCQDKAKTAEVLGDLAPKTYWMRDAEGAGGKGAQMLTGYLPGRNYSQEFVFFEGRQIAAFQKLRVSYSVKKKTEGLENVGSSAVSVCTRDYSVENVAYEAIRKVSEATGTVPHGFYGVDLKEDERGVAMVTEINAGRLLTASYSYFWLTGYNLPLVGVSAFFGEESSELPEYPLGYGIVRQVDMLPKLVGPEITKDWL